MQCTSSGFSCDAVHEACVRMWPALEDRLHGAEPEHWPAELLSWLDKFAGGEEGPGDSIKLAAVLVMINTVGRLHRDMTGTVRDAFRGARDRVFRQIRRSLSSQEVVTALDMADCEARAFEFAYLHAAA